MTCLLLLAAPARAQVQEGEAKEPWQLSFSGHARTMMESYEGLDLGLGPVEHDTWLHQRVQFLTSVDYRDQFRLAAELTWGRMWGKESALAPPDQDDVDFLQLFAQYRIPLGESDSLSIKAGRQTLYYGSGRLLASREGANQRLAHDALLLSWSPQKDITIDAFLAAPVEVRPGAFDNTSHPETTRFWSLYAVFPSPLGPDQFVDAYYIGLHEEDSTFAAAGETETRHTVGTRWWSKEGVFTYNSEFMLQFGSAGSRDILAGAVSLGLTRELPDLPWHPSFTLRADAISGGDPKGDTVHTFHPLFQANNYFNEGGFLSPSNLYNLNPLFTLRPHPQWEVTAGVNFLWRFDPDDAVYAPPLQVLAGAAPQGERYLGTAYNLAVTWKPTPPVEVSIGFTHHEAGPSLTSVGAGDEDYFQASLRITF